MKNNIIQGNAAQNMAITHVDGPAIVLAGPGSGKTFVIVERLKHLILNCDVDPGSILVITFTKFAANEMQHRFLKSTDSLYPEVCFGTFHSVFYQILRHSNPNSKLKIIPESNKFKIIKDVIFGLKRLRTTDVSENEIENVVSDNEQIKAIISEISRIKNTGQTKTDCIQSIPLKKHFPHIYKEYQKALEEYGFIDFDDMILKCHETLKNDSAICDFWSKRFKYILIDEYQDINSMQYKVIRLLCKSNNLFVVGDDDQSIYGFRGSDPEIMLKFSNEFSDCNPKMINLNINYRCGKSILENALLLINDNKIRYQKELIANETNGPGFVVPRKYINKNQQYSAIAAFIKKSNERMNDIAFLFRTNQESYSLANYLNFYGISTSIDKMAKGFFESPAVKLCEDYLRYIYEGKKREFFFRIMNKPLRYIPRECVQSEIVNEAKVLRFFEADKKKYREIEGFFRQLRMLSKMRPSLCVRFLRNEIGIDKLFPGEIDALNELTELSQSITDNSLFLKELHRLHEEAENTDKIKVKNSGEHVNILTMHGSKGLEYKIVWLPNLNEGIIPSRSSITQQQIEEERRMLYVAMTRAKTALIMSYITGSKENPMLPSRFLRPIRHLWENHSSPSSPSSGSSTSSSNSTSSR